MDIQQSPVPIKNRLVRQRITPTYIHHNIFNQPEPSHLTNVRYTPTYASTVFDCEGYAIQTAHSRSKKNIVPQPINRYKPLVYANQAKERKQADLYPCCIFFSEKPYQADIDEKSKAMEQINLIGGKTSRMRKIIEQVSNPIFGSGYFWKPTPLENPQSNHEYCPNAYVRPKACQSSHQEEAQVQTKEPEKQPQIKCELKNSKVEDQKLTKNPIQTKKSKVKIAVQAKRVSRQKNLTRFKSASNLATKSIKPISRP